MDLAHMTQASTVTADLKDLPQWVQLLPLGKVVPKDGREPWFVRDARAIVASSFANGPNVPIDYDHQTDFTRQSGNAAPAAGWIVEFEIREDGIWGQVEWTERGRAALTAKEYRFLSPVFMFDKTTREISRILRAALTNDPALSLKAVASADNIATCAALIAAGRLNEMEAEMCQRMNLDPSDFIATREATNG